jgi:hemoglobin
MRFDRIDEAGLKAQVERFYGRARQDPVLGPLFESAIQDWPPHIEAITDFWSGAMLKTGRYHGNPLAEHAKHPIQPAMFDRWLELWAQTALDLFEPEPAQALIERSELIGRSLKLGLFYRPGAPTLS